MSAVDRTSAASRGVRTRGAAARGGASWHPDLSRAQSLALLAPIIIVAALFLIYPLIKLAIDSFAGDEGIGVYAQIFQSPAMRRTFTTTFVSAAIVTVITIFFAIPVAWLLRATSNSALRATVWIAILIPFCMGVVIKNYALAIILSRNGVLNDVLLALGLVQEPVQLMYTSLAVVIGMVYAMMPFAVLSLYASFTTIDPKLTDAARSIGASRLRAARTIILPLALPGIAASATIIFAISIGFYVTPVMLGGIQSSFVAVLISNDIFQTFNYPRAAASAVLLLSIALVLLVLSLRIVGGRRLREALS